METSALTIPSPPGLPRRVALVHDWLTGMRGGERVLEVLLDCFEEPEIFTLFHFPGSVSRRLESVPIHVSFAQRLPFLRRFYRAYLPLFPRAVECFDLSGFDLVVSVSHCVALGAIVPPGIPYVCYCLTPMRYAWDQGPTYFREVAPDWAARWLPGLLTGLRTWDVAASHRADHFFAISRHVTRRIARYYRRRSRILHPPVDTELFSPAGEPEDYYLLVSALVAQKGIRLAIDAFNRGGRQLLIVGQGPLRRRFEQLAGSTVRFLGWQSDRALRTLYRHARAVVFPGEEDFGLVPLEAQACGRPVVALARGGALETVLDGKTGVLFGQRSPEALLAALDRLDGLALASQACRRQACRFSREVFQRAWVAALQETLATGGHEGPPTVPPPAPRGEEGGGRELKRPGSRAKVSPPGIGQGPLAREAVSQTGSPARTAPGQEPAGLEV